MSINSLGGVRTHKAHTNSRTKVISKNQAQAVQPEHTLFNEGKDVKLQNLFTVKQKQYAMLIGTSVFMPKLYSLFLVTLGNIVKRLVYLSIGL